MKRWTEADLHRATDAFVARYRGCEFATYARGRSLVAVAIITPGGSEARIRLTDRPSGRGWVDQVVSAWADDVAPLIMADYAEGRINVTRAAPRGT